MRRPNPVQPVLPRKRRLPRLLAVVAYAGLIIVALAQVLMALEVITDFLHRLGIGPPSGVAGAGGTVYASRRLAAVAMDRQRRSMRS